MLKESDGGAALARRGESDKQRILGILRIHVPLSVSPMASPMFPDGTTVPKEMTIEEIHDIQAGYITSARNLIQGGFRRRGDPRNTWIPAKPISVPSVQSAEDEYGGSKENRLRFLKELVELIDRETTDEKILGNCDCRRGIFSWRSETRRYDSDYSGIG